MKLFNLSLIKYILNFTLIFVVIMQLGCATQNKKIFGGMIVGSVIGAGIGSQLKTSDSSVEYKNRNIIISSVLFGLLASGAMAWHYRQVEDAKVELSGRYSRYRLCNPDEDKSGLIQNKNFNQLTNFNNSSCEITNTKVEETTIFLDDNTKWRIPVFRKRYLQPDREESQVISKRYLWEIIKPGSFVTRSQNPIYFSETETD